MTKRKHWSLHRDIDDIVWLSLDKQDSQFNTLSLNVLDELEQQLDHLHQELPSGVIIQSAKSTGYIEGTDIDELTKLLSESDALHFIQHIQAIFNKIENLPCPTLALIKGSCLGSGLELALASQYRIADDSDQTRLGFNEISLGLHPGFGGCTRLFKLVKPLKAFDLLLKGELIAVNRAKQINLIDYTVPERHLVNAARHTILKSQKKKSPGLIHKVLNYRVVRPWISKLVTRNITNNIARIHYPAPYAVIDLWLLYKDNDTQMMLEEAQSVARLVIGKSAQNLLRSNQLLVSLKAQPEVTKQEIKHIHVIGGGVMGGDIAAWCAMHGFSVTIQDTQHEILARVIQRAHDLYEKKLKQPRLINQALDKLTPDLHGNGLTRADIVIEAVIEDVDVKRDVIKNIETRLKPGAIIATNTSSISLESIASVLDKPERLVGLHFFNPVAKMPLVEIICRHQSQGVIDKTSSLIKQLDKIPLPVKNMPGFLVNRIMMPYMIEAMILVEEGIPSTAIDQAAVDFGMQMGPIELADTVGLDLCLNVAENLSVHMGINIPDILKKKVNKGHLGKKTGHGFYRFKDGTLKRKPLAKDYAMPVDLQDRLVMRMLNESVACLRDEITIDSDHIDAGMIFGAGFAPFRGGPIHYIESRGAEQLVKLLETLAQRYGSRFEPVDGWQQLINN